MQWKCCTGPFLWNIILDVFSEDQAVDTPLDLILLWTLKSNLGLQYLYKEKWYRTKHWQHFFFLPQCFDLTFFLKCEPCINPARPNEPHAKSKKNWIPSVKMRLTTKKRTAMCLLKLLIACKVSLILNNNNCIKTPSIKQSGLSNPGKKKKEKF